VHLFAGSLFVEIVAKQYFLFALIMQPLCTCHIKSYFKRILPFKTYISQAALQKKKLKEII